MITALILGLLIMFGILASLLIKGEAALSETDIHYQYVPLISLTQGSANDYTEAKIESGEAASNSGVVVQNNELKSEFVPNAFGKGAHGASVWDIKQWEMEPNKPVEAEAAQSNQQQFGVHTSPTTQTTELLKHQDGYLIGNNDFHEAQEAATNTGITQDRPTQEFVKTMPQEVIDGQTFGYLATKGQYTFYLNGAGNAAVSAVRLGIWARRVVIPLTELYFDRDTIEGLLDNVILASIFG